MNRINKSQLWLNAAIEKPRPKIKNPYFRYRAFVEQQTAHDNRLPGKNRISAGLAAAFMTPVH
jgi:hypothetical protein